MKVLLHGAQVFLDGELRAADLSLEQDQATGNWQVEEVRDPQQAGLFKDRIVDLTGKLILPGLADIHVHLREPGFSYKETIPTGTAAAARGGFTTVCAMPNLDPAPDNLAELQAQDAVYEQRAVVEVRPYACLTKGGTGRGELLDYAALSTVAVGFSDDGFGVQDEDAMAEIMRQIAAVGGLVAQHMEDLELSGDGYINDGEYAATHGHIGKPGVSEWSQLERDLRLVEQTGCNYHACHLSTKRSVELVRAAKAKGLPVTAEAAPHYLALSDDMLRDEGRFRMNPPIRSRSDMEAVAAALVDGTIDMVATDHAPHSAEEKDGPLASSLNGVVGLEISVPVVYTHFVRNGRMSVADFVRVMCTAPRERFKLGGGQILAGEAADFVVLDPEAEVAVDSADFLSMGHATPFEGDQLFGRIDLTVCQGTPVWDPDRLLDTEVGD